MASLTASQRRQIAANLEIAESAASYVSKKYGLAMTIPEMRASAYYAMCLIVLTKPGRNWHGLAYRASVQQIWRDYYRLIRSSVGRHSQRPIPLELHDWLMLDEIAVDPEPVPDAIDAAAEHITLLAAIEDLPPRQRDVVRMRLDGDSTLEIAGVLGISQDTARQHYCHAVRRLRAAMG